MKLTEILNNVKVEWKKLGEVCEIVTDYVAAGSFKTISDNVKYLNKPDYAQLIRTKDIKSKFQNLDTFVYVDKKAFNFLYRVNLNTECLILPNIGNCGEIYYIEPETLPYKNNVLGPNAIFVKSKSENNKFLYYLFLSIYFQKELYKITSKTGQGKFNKTELKKILIPIPPLEIQEKIAQILTNFSNYATELRTELRLRNKQYEYYRNLLLSKDYLTKLCLKFDKNPEIKTATLGEICEYVKNRISADFLNSSNYVGVENLLKDKQGKINSNYVPSKGNFINFKKNDILIGNIRPYLRKIWLSNLDGGTNGDVLAIRIINEFKKEISPFYLYYVLSSEDFFIYNIKHSKGAKMPRGDKNKILEFKILNPPLKVQNEVVKILDKFSEISSNLEKGLPKEIELRQKQYEFYRDLLLNFKNIDEKIR